MNITEAIQLMKMGRFVARGEWPNMIYVFLRGEEFRYSAIGIDSTWMPSHRDLLATDWKEITPIR